VLPLLSVPFGGRRSLAWRYYLIMVGLISLHEVSTTMGRRGMPSSVNAHSSLDAVQLISISDQMSTLHPSASRPPPTALQPSSTKNSAPPPQYPQPRHAAPHTQTFSPSSSPSILLLPVRRGPCFPTVGTVLSVRNGVVVPVPSSRIIREGEPLARF